MAKRRKYNRSKKKPEKKLQLSGGAVREIIAIFLIMIAVFLILALLNVTGPLGEWVLTGTKFIIGQAVYALPIALLLSAYLLFRKKEDEDGNEVESYKYNTLIGTIAFFIFLSSLVAAISMPANPSITSIGDYGGIIGYAVYSLMSPILNQPVSIFILIMLMIISLVIALNTSLRDIFKRLFSKEKSDDDEDDKEKDTKFHINNKLPIKGTIGKDTVSDKKTEPIMYSVDKDWKYPSIDLLEATSTQPDPGDAKANAKIISDTFSDFGFEVKMDGVDVGPTVAQYTLKPPTGVNLSKIAALDRNLALALEAQQIRIEAPIPGKSLVGIEVPNQKGATVRIKDIFQSKEYEKGKSKLSFALGRDVAGDIVTYDLNKAPHLLVAGATGTGKSVTINALLLSLLYRNSPSELKLILVDPKHVEMTLYNNIPHLLTPVITESDKTVSALKWAVAEMERRLKLLAEYGKRDIGEYNTLKDVDRMPYIVIVIDELFDLMMQAGKDVESLIQRISQMARAVGIHLVLATQRPSVNVITGTIKANVPTRMALTTASQVDSRTIIDMAGAEKLLGKGDMLFSSPEYIKPKRVQGVLVSNDEISAVTKFLREQRQPEYNQEVLAQSVNLKGGAGASSYDAMDDDLWEQAAEVVIAAKKGSSSLLQRRLGVGYARAAKLIDILEQKGVVSVANGSKPREVLVSSLEELNTGETDLQ
ncbi:MAG TPA: DNA translocase FtsK 4TM domain-containing protein [Candidatus Saccharibacteria bacterium]|nr:DNA translocase FtsK 4TM domain-containing protein [Candidatus Saccharibacteria bacterium]HMT39799.1 DNA translocase FtsK 4TM domain-containing protein [Candidatus Saccharibacteria bacterium]